MSHFIEASYHRKQATNCYLKGRYHHCLCRAGREAGFPEEEKRHRARAQWYKVAYDHHMALLLLHIDKHIGGLV